MLWRFRHTVHATSPPIWTEKPVTPRAALARLVGVRRNYGRSDTQLISAPRLRQGVLRHQPNQACPAEARLADATQPTLVVMGEQDPDFPDPRAEADWIALTLHAETRPLLPFMTARASRHRCRRTCKARGSGDSQGHARGSLGGPRYAGEASGRR